MTVITMTLEYSHAGGRPQTVILEFSDGHHEYYPVTDYSGAGLGNDVRHYKLGSPLITPGTS